jgi:hypothetical protein
MKHTKRIVLITLLAFTGTAFAFAGEQNGVVLQKNLTTDKKGNRNIQVFLDTTGNGITDTVLTYQLSVKQKDSSACLAELDTLIKQGSQLTFNDTNIQRPTGYFAMVVWHDLLSVDGTLMAQKYPNPYWFPAAFGIPQ